MEWIEIISQDEDLLAFFFVVISMGVLTIFTVKEVILDRGYIIKLGQSPLLTASKKVSYALLLYLLIHLGTVLLVLERMSQDCPYDIHGGCAWKMFGYVTLLAPFEIAFTVFALLLFVHWSRKSAQRTLLGAKTVSRRFRYIATIITGTLIIVLGSAVLVRYLNEKATQKAYTAIDVNEVLASGTAKEFKEISSFDVMTSVNGYTSRFFSDSFLVENIDTTPAKEIVYLAKRYMPVERYRVPDAKVDLDILSADGDLLRKCTVGDRSVEAGEIVLTQTVSGHNALVFLAHRDGTSTLQAIDPNTCDVNSQILFPKNTMPSTARIDDITIAGNTVGFSPFWGWRCQYTLGASPSSATCAQEPVQLGVIPVKELEYSAADKEVLKELGPVLVTRVLHGDVDGDRREESIFFLAEDKYSPSKNKIVAFNYQGIMVGILDTSISRDFTEHTVVADLDADGTDELLIRSIGGTSGDTISVFSL